MTKPQLIKHPTDVDAHRFRLRRHASNTSWFYEIRESMTENPGYEPLSQYVERLRKLDERLVEAMIDLDLEYGVYGDRDRDNVVITGWRRATDEEVESAKQVHRAKKEKRAATIQAHDDRMIAELKKRRPEVFKEA